MIASPAGTLSERKTAAADTGSDATQGWYLYGITRTESVASLRAAVEAGYPAGAGFTRAPINAAPLEVLEYSGLAACVGPVRPLTPLESAVRSHSGVIEAIHARQPILPARFGTIYESTEDIVSALSGAHDVLLEQLNLVDGCDEWSVHLFADRAITRARVASGSPAIRVLRHECATARPSRACFLEQRLRDTLETTTRQALATIAQRTFNWLAGYAVAAHLNAVPAVAHLNGEVEILRASFLVARNGAEYFKEEVRFSGDTNEGMRCENSGPCPPYSFAVRADWGTALTC